jgi:hypothetical protein
VPPTCSNCGAGDFVWANELKTGNLSGGTLSLRSRGEIPLGTRICRTCGHADLFLRDLAILHQPHTWRQGEFIPIVSKPAAPKPAPVHSHAAPPPPPPAATPAPAENQNPLAAPPSAPLAAAPAFAGTMASSNDRMNAPPPAPVRPEPPVEPEPAPLTPEAPPSLTPPLPESSAPNLTPDPIPDPVPEADPAPVKPKPTRRKSTRAKPASDDS